MNNTSSLIGIGLRHSHYATIFNTLPKLDLVEVHAENFFTSGGAIPQILAQISQYYPISLHGVGLSLGSACGLDEWHLTQLKRLVKHTQPLLISDHACFSSGIINGRTVHANDLLPLRFTYSSLDILCNNVNRVQDTLQRRIAVENISSYIDLNKILLNHSNHEKIYTEVDFLNTLAQRTGCGLLLDINNIYINALNAEFNAGVSDKTFRENTAVNNCQTWIKQVHSTHVMEIHLAGCTATDGIIVDDHATPVHDPVWTLYRHALEHIGHVPTLIEWDLELPALDVLLGEAAIAKQIASEVSV